MRTWWMRVGVGLAWAAGLGVVAGAQVAGGLYSGLRWRNIGPFRGGRVSSISGVIGQPNVYYAGMPLGGIWKTVSAGMRWFPVADGLKDVDSVGAIAVAPSDANVVYAGTGDTVTHGGINTGDGMYKSTDAGKTWTHIGLENTRHINAILVDPRNANLVLVSAQGNLRRPTPYGGIYRSSDGGQTWTQVLKFADNTGGRDIAWAYDDPSVVFATTISDAYVGRGRGFGPQASPNRTALYKSTDEGQTWSKVSAPTLPDMNNRSGVAVAMNTHGQRVFWIGNRGLWRSDDQGATWRHMAANDRRISGNGYICDVYVDPQNPEVVYVMGTATFRSSDGGQTFAAWKGAPGGDDNHVLWFNPSNGQNIMLGADQGAVVTYDGGKTWSSWYNLSNDQVYRISTDHSYPFWVLAPQQDSGETMIRSRSDFGQITMMTDWYLLPGSETGSVAADPLHPGVYYDQGYGASGGGGSVVKFSMKTAQWENVGPTMGPHMNLRADGNARRMFDVKWDPHALYMAYQCLMVTRNAGGTWTAASPDLTIAQGHAPVPCGAAEPRSAAAAGGGRFNRGADIADFAFSPVSAKVMWTVSSNAQVYKTVDGGQSWTNETNFSDLPAGSNDFVSVAPGLDANTAYVVDDRHNEGNDDLAPYIWRTHDGGASWTKIVHGLPTGDATGDFVRVVVQDPEQKGLLYCGTERTVYVSFDDGGHWQPLRLNLPTTSIRDMAFHTHDHMNDLVIGTFGRGIYILDDMTPLRAIARQAAAIAAAPAYLFRPGDAIRSRYDINWDTPIPPDMAHAENPPFGAILYYHLSQPPQGAITLQILDAAGNVVRSYTSVAQADNEPPPAVPSYWLATPESLALPTAVGTDRFHWDLRYQDPPAVRRDIGSAMQAIPHQATALPHGPMALPGRYTVKLTVDGQSYTQPLTVINDPRSGQSAAVMAGLRAQHRLDMLAYHAMKTSYAANEQVGALREQVTALQSSQTATVAAAAKALETKLAALGGAQARGRGFFGRAPAGPGPVAFRTLNGNFSSLVSPVGMDMAPTQNQIQAWEGYCGQFNTSLTAWRTMQSKDVAAFNTVLRQNGLPPVTAAAPPADPSCAWRPVSQP